MEIRRKPGAKQNLMHEGRVMMIGSDLVTIEAAAELFEVSERVVRNWFKRGASAWEDAIIKSVSRRLLMASSHKSAEAKLIVAVIGQAMADCMSILKYRFGKPASQISNEEAVSAYYLCESGGGVLSGCLGIDADYGRQVLMDMRYAHLLRLDAPIPLKARDALIVMGVISQEAEARSA